jgi:hypothetical protein
MKYHFAFALAKLAKLEPVRVVTLILGGGIIALFATGACEMNYNPIRFFCHLDFLLSQI